MNCHGGTIIGPQITFQDKEGVTGDLDIVVCYSLDPASVADLYVNYFNQENFVTKVVAQDVRSVSRQIPGQYGTLEFFNSRADAESAIFAALEKKWGGQPIIIEAVNLQEIRYSEEIKQRYDEAQAARVAVDRAQAEQDAATITAETARITAQGQADANAILEKSLTENVLRQRYIDALNNGAKLYIVPDGTAQILANSRMNEKRHWGPTRRVDRCLSHVRIHARWFYLLHERSVFGGLSTPCAYGNNPLPQAC